MSREQDRTAFYAQMIDNPLDKIGRLAYAGWLEDGSAENDLDWATVEFIKLSCGDKTEKPMHTMPKATYQFINDNGERLMPTFAEEIRRNTFQTWSSSREGRYVTVDYRRAKEKYLRLRVRFEFYYGFVRSVEFQSYPGHSNMIDGLMRSILADQPLAVRIPLWPRLIQLPHNENWPWTYFFTSDITIPQLIFNSGFDSRSWSDPNAGGFLRTPIYAAESKDVNDAESLAFRLSYLDILQARQRTDAAARHSNCRHNPEALPVDFSVYPQFVTALAENFKFKQVRNSGVLAHRRIGRQEQGVVKTIQYVETLKGPPVEQVVGERTIERTVYD